MRYFDQKRVLELRKEFEKLNPRGILIRAKEEFGDQLVMTSSFGPGGIVLLSIVKDIIPEIPVYFIDTKFHFKETLELVNKIKEMWDLNIITISTEYSEDELEEIIGKEAYKNNIDECCKYRKVKPLLEIIKPEITEPIEPEPGVDLMGKFDPDELMGSAFNKYSRFQDNPYLNLGMGIKRFGK